MRCGVPTAAPPIKTHFLSGGSAMLQTNGSCPGCSRMKRVPSISSQEGGQWLPPSPDVPALHRNERKRAGLSLSPHSAQQPSYTCTKEVVIAPVYSSVCDFFPSERLQLDWVIGSSGNKREGSVCNVIKSVYIHITV